MNLAVNNTSLFLAAMLVLVALGISLWQKLGLDRDIVIGVVRAVEDDREYMGHTLYLGSLKSDVYFCIYEKDYEQYVKLGTPLEEADIINRFEIRLRNERAYYAVRDLLTYYDAEQTAFSIINQYVRFVDEEPDRKSVV